MEFNSTLPRQKVLEGSKNNKWYEESINAVLNLCQSTEVDRRSLYRNKQINYDLLANKFHREDLKYVLNPLGLDQNDVPAELRHYDIVTPIFNLLIGEEMKRRFNFLVRSINEDAVSEKEETRKELIFNFLRDKLTADLEQGDGGQVSEEEEAAALKQLNNYINYEYQDIREITAERAVNYLKRDLDLEEKFLVGFEDSLVVAEELYRVDVINGEPDVYRCNPLETYFLLPHNSSHVDDAEMIVEETWMDVSTIIDNYYDELSSADIDKLEKLRSGYNSSASGDELNYKTPQKLFIKTVDNMDDNNYDYESPAIYVDSSNNIKVVKAVWKSRRKVGIRKYFDEATQSQEEVIVDENWIEQEGEEVDWKWINEYREGTKIYNDIYVNLRRCKVQRRSMDNISKCKSPYVGTIYNSNNSTAVSLMDRLIAYQYLYNIIFFRTETAFGKSLGKIMEFDLASIPREYGFDLDKWAYYLQAMNISFKNSFEESKKGERVGAYSGAGVSTREINMEQGQYIDQHINMLRFIEEKVEDLSGVSGQRKGNISTYESVGGVERSVAQSSHITEKWFHVHNNVKKRVFEALIDVSREAWRDGGKKIQYVMDDMSTVFLNTDETEYCNTEFSVFVSNSSRDNQALEQIKSLAHAGLQNDKLNFTQIMDIITTDSISATKRKIEQAEEQASRAAQSAQEAQVKQLAAEAQAEDNRNIRDNQTKIRVAEISRDAKDGEDTNKNEVGDSIDLEKLEISKTDSDAKIESDRRKLEEDIRKNKVAEDIKREELKIKRKQANKQNSSVTK